MDALQALTDRLTALEVELRATAARVQQLEDEREIRELLSYYAYRADAGQDDQWVELWADDAVYELRSTVNYPDGTVQTLERTWTGTSGMRELITDPIGHHRPGFYRHSLHAASGNLAIRVDGDDAVAHSYSFLYQESGDVVELVSAASNRWLLRRVDGRWRLRERHRGQVGTDSFVQHLPG